MMGLDQEPTPLSLPAIATRVAMLGY